MDVASGIATVMAASGFGAILFAITQAIIKQASGRAGRERTKNTDLLTREHEANHRADLADQKRRLALDEIARLRGMLIQRQIDPGPELDLERTLTPAQLVQLQKRKRK